MNLVFTALILFGSLITIYIVANNLITLWSKLRKIKNQDLASTVLIEKKGIQMQFKRDLIVFSILFFEIILKTISIVNIAYLNSHRPHNATQLQISNCSIVIGTAISRLYTRGYQYSILIATFQGCNLLILSLLCYLTMFLANVYREDKRGRILHAYLAYSILKFVTIIVLFPFPATYLFSVILYLGNFTFDYILLIYLSRRLFKLIQRSYLALLWHGGEEEKHQQIRAKRNVNTFRVFSKILIISYTFQVIGQNVEGIIVSLLGSFLENSCWFQSIYGFTYSVQFSKQAFELSGIIAVYVEFTLGTCFNIGLLVSYLAYCIQVVIRKRRKIAYRYHIERVRSITEPLLPQN